MRHRALGQQGWNFMGQLMTVAVFASTALGGISVLRAEEGPGLVIEGGEGPGKGKHVVFISGDEEYRSEEVCPMLAKVLAKHHGFKCTVLFALNPETGEIDPNNQTNIPGHKVLQTADLMVLFTRFRELPDDEMKYFVEYVQSGKPIIGFRTATHAFSYSRKKDSPYVDWSFNSEKWSGGFGRQVLGETWISHHGNHGSESTRGVIPENVKALPIVRGCEDIWGPTDVYGIIKLPENSQVLVQGQVLKGMKPSDEPVEGPKNNPMMPIAWTRTWTTETGKSARIFCTTMGAATDFESEGLRRLFVNASYWSLGMEDKIPEKAEVTPVGEFKATPFGNNRFKKGVKPADLK